LKKIETSSSRILKKESKINSFYDEISSKFEDKSVDEKSIIEIHLIAIALFNILFCQKDVEIFAVSMKNLEIQLKKQDSNKVTDSKSVISFEYHDFLSVRIFEHLFDYRNTPLGYLNTLLRLEQHSQSEKVAREMLTVLATS
jgi:hypothetical protein